MLTSRRPDDQRAAVSPGHRSPRRADDPERREPVRGEPVQQGGSAHPDVDLPLPQQRSPAAPARARVSRSATCSAAPERSGHEDLQERGVEAGGGRHERRGAPVPRRSVVRPLPSAGSRRPVGDHHALGRAPSSRRCRSRRRAFRGSTPLPASAPSGSAPAASVSASRHTRAPPKDGRASCTAAGASSTERARVGEHVGEALARGTPDPAARRLRRPSACRAARRPARRRAPCHAHAHLRPDPERAQTAREPAGAALQLGVRELPRALRPPRPPRASAPPGRRRARGGTPAR